MFNNYTDEESFKDANGYIIDGIWYPRVTKIVSIKAKPALYRFYGEVENFKAGQNISQQSAKEGTLIHETIEALFLGQKPDIDPSIEPAIRAFLEFMERKRIEVSPELIEKRIVSHTHRYAGTADALALIDGKFGVLDIKTSQSIYRDYNLQTAAYINALKDNFQNLQTRWILRVDQIQVCKLCGAVRRVKGGREKIRIDWKNKLMKNCQHEWSDLLGEIELKEMPYWRSDFEAFLAAKRLWEWENEFWLKKIGYL